MRMFHVEIRNLFIYLLTYFIYTFTHTYIRSFSIKLIFPTTWVVPGAETKTQQSEQYSTGTTVQTFAVQSKLDVWISVPFVGVFVDSNVQRTLYHALATVIVVSTSLPDTHDIVNR